MTSELWDTRYDQADAVWSGRVNPTLAEVAEPLRPGRALDLGCGEGGDAIWLAQHQWTVTGVDFSAVGIARAELHAEQLNVHRMCSWLVADLTSTEFSPEFDLVTSHFLHVESDARSRMWRTMAHSVGGGGTLLVVGHHPDDSPPEGRGPRNPDVLFSAEHVLSAISAAGVEWSSLDAEERTHDVDGPNRRVTTIVRATAV